MALHWQPPLTYLILSLAGVSPELTVLAMAKNILSSGVLPSSPQLELGEVTASELVPDDRLRVVAERKRKRERERGKMVIHMEKQHNVPQGTYLLA